MELFVPPNFYFVDLQGFKNDKNEFIVKEFAIATITWSQTFLVKPPYSSTKLNFEEKKQTKWLERNRGILWDEGFIGYTEFLRTITRYIENKNVMVKGVEKMKWVKSLCSNCIIHNIEDTGCPNFSILHDKYKMHSLNCPYHERQCATKNALCIGKWYLENHL